MGNVLGKQLVDIEISSFKASATAWDAVAVDLGPGKSFSVPGKTSGELKKMKNVDLVTYTLMFPDPPGWRPKLAARSQYGPARPVSVQKVEPAATKARETVELPDGFTIGKTKSKIYGAGPRTVTFEHGMLSANPMTYGDFKFVLGPIECKLKNFPAYPLWHVVVQNGWWEVGYSIFPYGHPGAKLPLAPKDNAEIVLAAYEKAVGQAFDFDCLATMMPMVMSLAGGVSPERNMRRFAEATKAARAVLLDRGGCYGDIPEVSIRIGEAYEAANLMEDAIYEYWLALKACLAKPKEVASDAPARSWVALGIVLKRTGRLDAAEACYRNCLLEKVCGGEKHIVELVIKVYGQRGQDDETNRLGNERSRKNQTEYFSSATMKCAACSYPDRKKEQDELRELKRCSGCRLVLFCSAECQQAYWPKHKGECQLQMENLRKLTRGEAPEVSSTINNGVNKPMMLASIAVPLILVFGLWYNFQRFLSLICIVSVAIAFIRWRGLFEVN